MRTSLHNHRRGESSESASGTHGHRCMIDTHLLLIIDRADRCAVLFISFLRQLWTVLRVFA